ncbi:hypothetical protein M7I_7691 [Glarea lozoyensis 74030]|uniref:Uncharacterized protein n=1 Tax=Glarea lozoyensis (strain ATCC 74030 / MF5533) TaxID=1104152 RepID=H0EXZ7_GLAL7|nr:hypothetical protein M7I_7691 [Glarea lozoyensis 74030]
MSTGRATISPNTDESNRSLGMRPFAILNALPKLDLTSSENPLPIGRLVVFCASHWSSGVIIKADSVSGFFVPSGFVLATD